MFVDVGALFSVTPPLLTQNLPGNTIFIPSRDANGAPLYFFAGDPATTADDRTLAIPPGGTVPPGFVALGRSTDPFQEVFLGDTASPRISVGIGVNWNSPFGPLRLDLARAIKKAPGDYTKLFTFNVGTRF